MKFALVSNVLPPSGTAHAAVIFRLLSDLDPSSYVLLSSTDYTTADPLDASARLPGKYYHLSPVSKRLGVDTLPLPRIARRLMAGPGVALRARTIAGILRREGCDAVVVCTGGNEVVDFPAAYLASRWTGTRFHAYLLDQYTHMVSYVLGNSFLRRFESRILRAANSVIVPNEHLQEEVRRRHGVEAAVIHNPCDLSLYEGLSPEVSKRPRPEPRPLTIVYTGAIGVLHYEPFRTLLVALRLLKPEDARLERARLHIYTNQSPRRCAARGIVGPVEFHAHQPAAAMPRIQSDADILFLPLALESRYPEIVRTAAPGKMGEFLAAGRPILVHAPADSFIASYFRRHGCGLVVDSADPALLAEGIETLASDPRLGAELGRRARERARVDFSLQDARIQFAQALGLTADQRPDTSR